MVKFSSSSSVTFGYFFCVKNFFKVFSRHPNHIYMDDQQQKEKKDDDDGPQGKSQGKPAAAVREREMGVTSVDDDNWS